MVSRRTSARARRAGAGVCLLLLLAVGSSALAAVPEDSGDHALRLLVSRVGDPSADEDVGIWWSHIAGNGKVAFVWTRYDLVGGLPTTDGYRLFAVDIATNQIRLVTPDSRFKPGAVSSDGSFVVGSYEISNRQETAVIVDATDGSIHAIGLQEPLTFLREVTISADNTTIAFAATTGLGEDLSPNRMFIADVATGVVTEPLAGADGDLFDLYLSADATELAFASQAGNLDMPAGSRGSNAVVYDRVAGTLEYAYRTVDGGVPDGQSAVDGISADGNKVLIRAEGSNYALESTPTSDGGLRPFVYDRSTGLLTPIATPELGGGFLSVGAHSADLGVIAVYNETDGGAVLYDVVSGASSSLYGPGVVPDGVLWTGALDPVSLDDSGRVAVILSHATNLGRDGDGAVDAFIVGAAPPDPAGAVYVAPRVALPPDLIAPPVVSPPRMDPPPETTTTTMPAQPDHPPAPTGPGPHFSANPLLEIACSVHEAAEAGFLDCGPPPGLAERVLADLLVRMLKG